METIRQQIINYLDTIFKGIQVDPDPYAPTNYNYSIDEVFCWATDYIPRESTITLLYRDTDETTEPLTIGRGSFDQHRLTVEVDIISALVNNTAADARLMLADLNKAIGQDFSLGGLAQSTSVTSNTISVMKEETQIVNLSVNLQITYITKSYNLYEK